VGELDFPQAETAQTRMRRGFQRIREKQFPHTSPTISPSHKRLNHAGYSVFKGKSEGNIYTPPYSFLLPSLRWCPNTHTPKTSPISPKMATNRSSMRVSVREMDFPQLPPFPPLFRPAGP